MKKGLRITLVSMCLQVLEFCCLSPVQASRTFFVFVTYLCCYFINFISYNFLCIYTFLLNVYSAVSGICKRNCQYDMKREHFLTKRERWNVVSSLTIFVPTNKITKHWKLLTKEGEEFVNLTTEFLFIKMTSLLDNNYRTPQFESCSVVHYWADYKCS